MNNVGSNIPVQRVHGSPRFVVIELSLNTDSQSCDRNFWKGRIIGKSVKETGIELRNILIPLERSFPPSTRETRLSTLSMRKWQRVARVHRLER